MKQRVLGLVAGAALFAMQAASAQYIAGGGGSGPAAGDWELRIGPQFIESKTIDFQGGASAKVDSSTGVKIGAGYYLTDGLVLGGNFSWSHADFSATAASATGSGTYEITGGHVDSTTFIFDARYKFLDGPFRPWVEAGLGGTWISTNIPNGYAQAGCWWDPWWGYICGTYQSTKGGSAFAGQLGAGFEVNFNRSYGLSAGYLWTEQSIDHASGHPAFSGIEVMFNWRFTGY